MNLLREAIGSAERLANLLQDARGTSSARWEWKANENSLQLLARDTVLHGAQPLRQDLLAAGEVLHLVRLALTDQGWQVRTGLLGEGECLTVATLRIVGSRASAPNDELFTALQTEVTDSEPAVTGSTAMILLQDAAVEHQVRLAAVDRSDLEVLGVRISQAKAPRTSWRTVAPGSHWATHAAVLTTEEDNAEAHLLAGAASAEIQLTAAALGLEAEPVTESIRVVEVDEGYAQVAFLLTSSRTGHRLRPSVSALVGPQEHRSGTATDAR